MVLTKRKNPKTHTHKINKQDLCDGRVVLFIININICFSFLIPLFFVISKYKNNIFVLNIDPTFYLKSQLEIW